MNDPERDPWPSVDSDDRCPHCTAGDGEDCDPWCSCLPCVEKRVKALDVDAGDPVMVRK